MNIRNFGTKLGKNYAWEVELFYPQFNIVHNYYSITNILICERRSVFGCQTEFNIKIVTPTYKKE